MIVPIIFSLILSSYALDPKEAPLHPDTKLNIVSLDRYFAHYLLIVVFAESVAG